MSNTSAPPSGVDPVNILVENLRESLRLSHRYLVTGLVTSMLALSIAIGETQAKDQAVQISGVTVTVPSLFVVSFCLAMTASMGFFTLFTIARAYDTVYLLRGTKVASPYENKDLADLALTYPSVFTFDFSAPRRIFIVLPGVISVIAAHLYFSKLTNGFTISILIGVTTSPYLGMLIMTWQGLREYAATGRSNPKI
jgi:hypothetical protein